MRPPAVFGGKTQYSSQTGSTRISVVFSESAFLCMAHRHILLLLFRYSLQLSERESPADKRVRCFWPAVHCHSRSGTDSAVTA